MMAARPQPRRNKIPRTYRFEPRLVDKIRKFLGDHEMKPKEVDLVSTAIDEFIDKRWPILKKKGGSQ